MNEDIRENVYSAIKKMTKAELAQFLNMIDQSGVASEFVCTEKCQYYESCGGGCVYAKSSFGMQSMYEAFLSLDYSDVCSEQKD